MSTETETAIEAAIPTETPVVQQEIVEAVTTETPPEETPE